MKNITDEILNLYLDGELNQEVAAEVKAEINSDSELRKRFYSLRLVHNKLQNMHVDEVGKNFTMQVMQKIKSRFSVPKEQKYFIAAILTIVVLLSLTALGYVIAAVISAFPAGGEQALTFNTLESFTNDFINQLKAIFSGKNLGIIGSFFSFLLIISVYSFYEYQKKIKTNFNGA